MAITDDAVYFCKDTSLYAIGSRDGIEHWSVDLEDQLTGVSFFNGLLHAGGSFLTPEFFAVNAATGEQVWQVSDVGLDLTTVMPILFDSGLLIAATESAIYGFDFPFARPLTRLLLNKGGN
jgi:outer membrane protein assembly factor BamB